MSIGVVVGAAGAFQAKRKVEAAVERYLPEQVADRAAASARGLAGTVRAAATEGRDVMRSTEAELRARVEARTFTGSRPAEQDGTVEGSAPPEPSARANPPGPRRTPRASRPTPGASTARRRARR